MMIDGPYFVAAAVVIAANNATHPGTVDAKGAARVLGRIIGWSGAPVDAETIADAAYTIFDAKTGAPVSGHSAIVLDPADVFVAPTTHKRWPHKAPYNFVHDVDGSAFPIGGRLYRVTYRFWPVEGEQFIARLESVYARPTSSS